LIVRTLRSNDYFRVADHTPDIVLADYFGWAQPAGLLVFEICGELDLARAGALNRLTKPGKRNGACAEKRIDCGGGHMVEEVKELHN
jgi:hypothetical protein